MTLNIWLAIASVVIGALISWLISRHFYKRADKRRIPTFVLQAKREMLATHELVKNTGISVLHRGQEVGISGISAVSVYFWNSGTLPILPDEILEPFSIRVLAEILDCKVLKVSREAVGFQVQQEGPTKLNLKFSVLEPGDGATIRLLYDGPVDTTVEFSGACLDAQRPVILPPGAAYFMGRRERFYEVLALPLAVLALSAVAGLVIGFFSAIKWLFGERVQKLFASGLFVVVIVLFVAMMGKVVWEWGKRLTAKYIPPDIKP